MQTWHYLDRQNRPKQVIEEELTSLTNSGEIRPTSHIWKEGMTDWLEEHVLRW